MESIKDIQKQDQNQLTQNMVFRNEYFFSHSTDQAIYEITIENAGTSINLSASVEISGQMWKGQYNLEDLRKKPFLNNFDSLTDIYESVIIKMQEKHYELFIQDNQNLVLIIEESFLKKVFKIDFELQSSQIGLEQQVKIMQQNAQKMKATIQQQEEQIKALQTEVQKLYITRDTKKKVFEKINSDIIKYLDYSYINDWITNSILYYTELALIYKGSKHGFAASKFHELCDGKTDILVLIQTVKNQKFGGYTKIAFNTQAQESYTVAHSSNDCFVFSLTLKMKYEMRKDQEKHAIFNKKSLGPTFGGGHDFCIADNCSTSNENYCNFPYSFGCLEQKSLLSQDYNFKVKDIEVFQVKKVPIF